MSDNEIEAGERIVALVRDLMFASRVRGAAPGAAVAQSLARFTESVGPETRLAIVELEAKDGMDAIREVRQRAPGARVVAFGPHVMEAALSAAQEAGAEAMPRGAFVKQLPGLVAETAV